MDNNPSTHWGIEAMFKSIRHHILSIQAAGIIKTVVRRSELCLKNNPNDLSDLHSEQPREKTARLLAGRFVPWEGQGMSRDATPGKE